MTSQEITLIKDSFRKLVPFADQAAALFYARLFELDPRFRARFRGDMAEQGRKLMAVIAMAVASLEQPERLIASLRELGAPHLDAGAEPEHHRTVGQALFWTVEKGLGPEFTPAVRAAWTGAYDLVSTTLLSAQRSAAAA